jgi:predicted glycoside hydrolase/deacetylase ChbG (UPF0249 family)
VEAQLQRFVELAGRPPSHFDGHNTTRHERQQRMMQHATHQKRDQGQAASQLLGLRLLCAMSDKTTGEAVTVAPPQAQGYSHSKIHTPM